jgi:putative ATPase
VYDEDEHYDTISAFIKSIRGSDPDAALYWMAKMISAGEDPLFIARRIVISASEDIGNADPRALMVATAAYQAVERIGMPEGSLPLAQAVTYLASSPKSNAAYLGIKAALKDIEMNPVMPVPDHLKDASYKGAARLGRGKGYQYPHDFPGHFVQQDYLPQKRVYYRPTEQGDEKRLKERLAGLRKYQEERKA